MSKWRIISFLKVCSRTRSVTEQILQEKMSCQSHTQLVQTPSGHKTSYSQVLQDTCSKNLWGMKPWCVFFCVFSHSDITSALCVCLFKATRLWAKRTVCSSCCCFVQTVINCLSSALGDANTYAANETDERNESWSWVPVNVCESSGLHACQCLFAELQVRAALVWSTTVFPV